MTPGSAPHRVRISTRRSRRCARLRSGEYVIRAAATGISGIIAPDGSWQARLPLECQGIVYGDDRPPVRSLFSRIGPTRICIALISLYLLLIACRRGARRKMKRWTLWRWIAAIGGAHCDLADRRSHSRRHRYAAASARIRMGISLKRRSRAGQPHRHQGRGALIIKTRSSRPTAPRAQSTAYTTVSCFKHGKPYLTSPRRESAIDTMSLNFTAIGKVTVVMIGDPLEALVRHRSRAVGRTARNSS